MNLKTQRGFTLIELVVVIVILGILAAFAVPRFMGLETEARVAAVKSMGGTLRSAAAMAHGVCMARNCANGGAGITINGQTIVFAQGYPNTATVERTIESFEGFTVATNAGGRRFLKTGARTNACWVRYNPPAGANLPPTITYNAGVIGVGGVTEAAVDADLRNNC
jgi:MSHA pilin protein MshA